MILFTDFVIDPLIRSQIGEIYFWLSLTIIALNVLITIIVILRKPYIYLRSKMKIWQEKKTRLKLIKERKKMVAKMKKKEEEEKQKNL